MVIETSHRTYRVLLHQVQETDKDIYLCENTADHRHWRVISMKIPGLDEKVMDFLYTQMRQPDFSDFEECFTYQGNFYLVFACPQGKRLTDKLTAEQHDLQERMEIGKKLMEKLILQSMHPYFICQCLREEEIYITDSLEITFAYNVNTIQSFSDNTFQEVKEHWRKLVSFLFGRELYLELIPPMKAYLHELWNGSFHGLMEVYDGYQCTCTSISHIPCKHMETPRRWEFRVWKKIRTIGRPLKLFGAGLLFAAVFAFMLWNIEQMRYPSKQVRVISQIGTMMLEDHNEPKEDSRK